MHYFKKISPLGVDSFHAEIIWTVGRTDRPTW